MVKKAGKKTQSNRSNKTRRNVRNRKNTKKQKRRTNKQNRKKRATRKRHGVKRGGAASAAAEERKLPAMVSQKGDFVELMAHHLNNREIYECVTVIFQQGLEYNKEYKPMILAVGAALHNGIDEVGEQTGTYTPQEKSLFQNNHTETDLKLLALKGEKDFDENILQPKLQNFYDLGTLLQSFSIQDEITITNLLENRSSRLKTMIENMLPFMGDVRQDATKEMSARIIENVCILIQGLPPSVQINKDGVVFYRRITNRISNIYNDLAKVVSIVYDKDPTIVLTLIELIISSELLIKTLAKNEDFIQVQTLQKADTFTDLCRQWVGVAACPTPVRTELMGIQYSRLLFSGKPLIPLQLDKILEEKEIWWKNVNISKGKEKMMNEIPMTHDRPILFNALFRIISDIESDHLNDGTFYDILRIVMGMHNTLKERIMIWLKDTIREFTSKDLGDIKTSIIQTIENKKHEIIDDTFKVFNSLGLDFKQRIMTSIDKVMHDLVARYVYVDIKIKKQQDLESKDVLEERKDILEELLERETPEVVNNRWLRLDKMKQSSAKRKRNGANRLLKMTAKTAEEAEAEHATAKWLQQKTNGPYSQATNNEILFTRAYYGDNSHDILQMKANEEAKKREERAKKKIKSAKEIADLVRTLPSPGSTGQTKFSHAIEFPLPTVNKNGI